MVVNSVPGVTIGARFGSENRVPGVTISWSFSEDRTLFGTSQDCFRRTCLASRYVLRTCRKRLDTTSHGLFSPCFDPPESKTTFSASQKTWEVLFGPLSDLQKLLMNDSGTPPDATSRIRLKRDVPSSRNLLGAVKIPPEFVFHI